MSTTHVVLVMGFPASGKSTLTADLAAQGYAVLNRDTEGGTMAGLLQKFRDNLVTGAKIVLDNTFCTVADRAPFINAAAAVGLKLDCVWMATSAEDAQVNALHRMWDRYGQVFLDKTVTWAAVVTLLTGNSTLRVVGRDELIGSDLTDATIAKIVSAEWRWSGIEDFAYLAWAAQPPLWLHVLLYVLGVVGAVGGSFYMINKDVFGEEGWSRSRFDNRNRY